MKKLLLLLFTLSVTLYASSIKVADAYVRATPPGLPNSAAFMQLNNSSNKDISLVKASSDIAKAVELHTHEVKNGAMMMYQVPQIDIKANSATTLQPGGFHIMLIGLTQKPLKVGEHVKLKLHFSNEESIDLNLPIKSVMQGMKKKSMSCGSGKCGSSSKSMSCGAGKCGKGKCGSN